MIGSKLKRLQKKNKVNPNVNLEEILNEIPSPSIKNTLPFQIPRAIWNTPSAIKACFVAIRQHQREENERKQRVIEEEEELKAIEEEIAKEKEAKSLRKRNKPKVVAPEKTEEELSGYSNTSQRIEIIENVKNARVVSGGIWTDEDLAELTRLVKKYPGGTTDRWELIADALYRNVAEVTHMAHKLKENNYRAVSAADASVAETLVAKAKVKTKKNDQILVPETNWSQEQQQALEAAIVKYPKSTAADRWVKISNCIPGKTKEECMIRYKYLVEIVKKQRQAHNEPEKVDKPTTDENLDNAKGVSQNNDKNKDDEKVEEDEDEEEVEEIPVQQTKGKKRNLRKERKKKMDFSSDEDDDE